VRRLVLAFATLSALVSAAPAAALDDGLARTPPMGWNGWYAFGCQADEATVRAAADALVSSGLRDAGYTYVNVDDCWMARTRGPDGALRPDPERFGGGIPALADYVHRRGLRLGIYLSTGRLTCERYPGSAGHLAQDARTVAAWGVDLVKLDWCFMPHTPARVRVYAGVRVYAEMRDAIRASGRPIVVSISEWGDGRPWTWGAGAGHMWRTTHDIPVYDRRDRWRAVLRVAARNAQLAGHAGPGGWNDPDILQVGLRGLSATEGRTMFSMWAMMAAPLLAGNDLGRMDGPTRGTLGNREVIAIDQDPLGVPGLRVSSKNGLDVWVRPLWLGDRAVLFVNRTSRTRLFRGSPSAMFGGNAGTRFSVRDLWNLRTFTVTDELTSRIPAHGAAMFRIHPLGP
jgi:alpha-galactosidase